ncbi:MAG: GHMP kinase [Pedobacter sp.]|nr:MAG: GHMP kinase [Pedobacter sp.]
MNQRFYSNGKLLITAEYLVLDGAKALAIPTKMGQDLTVTEISQTNVIYWQSFDADQSVWFEDKLFVDDIISNNLQKDSPEVREVLKKILFEAHQLNPEILINKGFEIKTHLTFPRNWGLGTSSTLINNIAQWFEINAFELLKNSFGGSGYDIANAQNIKPITYCLANNKPIIETVDFNPDFAKNIYFLYLNKKQNSKSAIANYYSKRHEIDTAKSQINNITAQIVQGVNQSQFENLLQQHEELLSQILETETVKQLYFPDFNGTIKSLGAWGGDFVLVVSDTDPEVYFKEKGFTTLIPFHEMIL